MKKNLWVRILSLGLLASVFASAFVGCNKKGGTSSNSTIETSSTETTTSGTISAVSSSEEVAISSVSEVSSVSSNQTETSSEAILSSEAESSSETQSSVSSVSSSEAIVNYTITYYLDDMVYATETKVNGSKTTAVNCDEEYIPEHYTFVGWKLEGQDTILPEGSLFEVTSNLNYYGVFEKEKVEVSYYAYGNLLNTVEVPYGDKYTIAPLGVELNEDKQFAGWYLESDEKIYTVGSEIEVTSNLSFDAVINKYITINYYVNDELYKSDKIISCSPYTIASYEGEIPEGKVFKGWSVDDEVIKSVNQGTEVVWDWSYNLYGTVDIPSYTVTFRTYVDIIKQYTVHQGDKIEVPDIPFVHSVEYLEYYWADSNKNEPAEYFEGTSDLIYYVDDRMKTYTITYIDEDNNVINTQTAQYSTAYYSHINEKEGYYVSHLVDENGKTSYYTENSEIIYNKTSDTTYVVYYKEKTSYVVKDAEGNVVYRSGDIQYGIYMSLSSINIEGIDFNDYKEVNYIDEESVSHKRYSGIYAEWEGQRVFTFELVPYVTNAKVFIGGYKIDKDADNYYELKLECKNLINFEELASMVSRPGYVFDGIYFGGKNYHQGDVWDLKNESINVTIIWAEAPKYTLVADCTYESLAKNYSNSDVYVGMKFSIEEIKVDGYYVSSIDILDDAIIYLEDEKQYQLVDVPTKETAYKVNYSSIVHTVEFVINDEVVLSYTILTGEDVSVIPTDEEVGPMYKVTIWNCESENCFVGLNISAEMTHLNYENYIFVPQEYTVNGCVEITGADKYNQKLYGVENTAVTLPNVEITGYSFQGWVYADTNEEVDVSTFKFGHATTCVIKPVLVAKTYEIHLYGLLYSSYEAINETHTMTYGEEYNLRDLMEGFRVTYIACGDVNISGYGTWKYDLDTENVNELTCNVEAQNNGVLAIFYDPGKKIIKTVPLLKNVEFDIDFENNFESNREGFHFEGWTLDYYGTGEEYSLKNTYSGDSSYFKIYPRYVGNTYTIYYDWGDGYSLSGISSQTVTYHQPVSLPTDYYRKNNGELKLYKVTCADGYKTETSVSASWPSYNFDCDITLTAVWKYDTYTITYYTSGGGTNNGVTQSYEIGDEINYITSNRTGYKFIGWKLDGKDDSELFTDVFYLNTKNITLRAVYEAEKYNLTFDLNRDDVEKSVVTIEATYGERVTPSSEWTSRTGYTFQGWYYGKNFINLNYIEYPQISSYFLGDDKYTFQGDVTLTALWSGQSGFLILYDYDNSQIGKSVAVKYDSVYTFDESQYPTREDYTFLGYFDPDGNQLTPSFTNKYPSQITGYAKYVYNKATIHFNLGYDYDVDDITNLELGDIVTLPTPKRYGYNFLGWYYNGKPVSNNYNVTEKYITLTAEWDGIGSRIAYEEVYPQEAKEELVLKFNFDTTIYFGDEYSFEIMPYKYKCTVTVNDVVIPAKGKWSNLQKTSDPLNVVITYEYVEYTITIDSGKVDYDGPTVITCHYGDIVELPAIESDTLEVDYWRVYGYDGIVYAIDLIFNPENPYTFTRNVMIKAVYKAKTA